MKRRILALLLVVFMLTLFACTPKEPTASDPTKKPGSTDKATDPPKAEKWSLPYQGKEVHIRLAGEMRPSIDPDSLFGKFYQEQLGNLYTDVEHPGEDSSVLMRTYLASGDMPDILMYRDVREFANYYNDGGRTKNLYDYKEYMPEYFERREMYPHLKWYDVDDKTFYLFGTTWNDAPSEVWFQNQDLVDKYNLKIPTNYEEMKANMKIVCDAEPDVSGILLIPWGFNYQFTHYGRLHGVYVTSWSASAIVWDYDNDKWVYTLYDHPEAYKQTAIAMAEAYNNGWIHKDFITMDYDTYNNLSYNGKWLYTFIYCDVTNQNMENNYTIPLTYIDPPAAKGVTPSIKVDFTSDNWNYHFMIAKNTKYPELCASLLELVTSKKFTEVYYWGWEGKTFDWNDDGTRSYKEEFLKLSPEENLATVGILGGAWFHNFTSQFAVQDAMTQSYAPEIKRGLEIAADKVESGDYRVYYNRIGPNFKQRDNDEITSILNSVATYVQEGMTDFVLGRKPLSEWDSFIDGISDIGDIDRVLEIYNSYEPGPSRPTQFERKYIRP